MDIRGDGAREYWSNRATTYGQQYGLDTQANKLKIRRKVEMMLRDVGPDEYVLELGCGTGLYTEELAKRLKRLVASDLSGEMLKVAWMRCPDTTFMILDSRETKLLSGSVDTVVTAFMLQHTEVEKCLLEIKRVLRNNGKLVALVPNILNPLHYARARVEMTRKLLKENSQSEDFTRWQWEKLLKRHGYTQVKVSPVEFTSPYVPVWLVGAAMKMSAVLEGIPVVREFAGTLLITARKEDR
jgi:ubiquinone/menaquinone biosynthesis C-methylase UbiE